MEDAKTKVEPVGYVNDSFRDALLEHKGSVYWHGQMVCGKPFDGSHPIYLAAPQPTASDVPHDVVRALEEALELLQEKRHGNPARSPGHNAQHAIKRALDALATPAPSTSTEEALRAENARLREALKPFAHAAESLHESAGDARLVDLFTVGSKLTAVDLRRARSALSR